MLQAFHLLATSLVLLEATCLALPLADYPVMKIRVLVCSVAMEARLLAARLLAQTRSRRQPRLQLEPALVTSPQQQAKMLRKQPLRAETS